MAWVMLFSYPLMAAIQEISARIGRVTGQGIASNIRTHYPAWLLRVIAGMLLIANIINLGADLGAMGQAAKTQTCACRSVEKQGAHLRFFLALTAQFDGLMGFDLDGAERLPVDSTDDRSQEQVRADHRRVRSIADAAATRIIDPGDAQNLIVARVPMMTASASDLRPKGPGIPAPGLRTSWMSGWSVK
jgi:hypothetical protein